MQSQPLEAFSVLCRDHPHLTSTLPHPQNVRVQLGDLCLCLGVSSGALTRGSDICSPPAWRGHLPDPESPVASGVGLAAFLGFRPCVSPS